MCSDKESQEELTKEACMCVDEIEKVVCRFYGRLEEAYARPRKKAQNLKAQQKLVDRQPQQAEFPVGCGGLLRETQLFNTVNAFI